MMGNDTLIKIITGPRIMNNEVDADGFPLEASS